MIISDTFTWFLLGHFSQTQSLKIPYDSMLRTADNLPRLTLLGPNPELTSPDRNPDQTSPGQNPFKKQTTRLRLFRELLLSSRPLARAYPPFRHGVKPACSPAHVCLSADLSYHLPAFLPLVADQLVRSLNCHLPVCMSACHPAIRPIIRLLTSSVVHSPIWYPTYPPLPCQPTLSPIHDSDCHPLRSFTDPSARPSAYLPIDSSIHQTSLPLSRQSDFNPFVNPPPARQPNCTHDYWPGIPWKWYPSDMQSQFEQGYNSRIHIILLDTILSRTTYTLPPPPRPITPLSLDHSRLNLSRQSLLSCPLARAYPPVRQGVQPTCPPACDCLTADPPAHLSTRLSLSLLTSNNNAIVYILRRLHQDDNELVITTLWTEAHYI